jgi:hypothetical protein
MRSCHRALNLKGKMYNMYMGQVITLLQCYFVFTPYYQLLSPVNNGLCICITGNDIIKIYHKCILYILKIKYIIILLLYSEDSDL